MGSARAAPNFSGSGARVWVSGWGGGGSLSLAPARAAPIPARDGSSPSPLRRDNELRPQLGESAALLETPARMGGQSAPENAKARSRNRARWRCLGGCVGVRGVVAAVQVSVICRSGGRSSEERAAPGRAAPPGRVSPCPSAPLPRCAPLGHAGSLRSPIFGEVVKSSLASFVSAAPTPFHTVMGAGARVIWRLLSLA